MSQLVGMEIEHSDTASLHEMIEIGMIKHSAKLEEISIAATKEYTLERALEKMKMEWDDVIFTLNPYRYLSKRIFSGCFIFSKIFFPPFKKKEKLERIYFRVLTIYKLCWMTTY